MANWFSRIFDRFFGGQRQAPDGKSLSGATHRSGSGKKGHSKQSPMSSQALTDITRGLHHAASATSDMLAQQYLMMLKQFFDYDEESNMLKAKMVEIEVDKNNVMKVPLISLVAPKGLALDNFRVEMSIQVDSINQKPGTMVSTSEAQGLHKDDDNSDAHDKERVDNTNATRSSFKVFVAPPHKESRWGSRRRSDLVDLTLEFKAGDPPEGVMRIIDQYANMVNPVKRTDMQKAGKENYIDMGKFFGTASTRESGTKVDVESLDDRGSGAPGDDNNSGDSGNSGDTTGGDGTDTTQS